MEADPTKAEPPKRLRRWFQFSLRTLMIFMAVVALACGWLATKIEKKRRERQAVELVLSKGGQVGFDYQRWKMPAGHTGYKGNVEPPGPAWLRSILGENFFSEAEMVFINYQKPSTLTDADLDSIKNLGQLESLWLPGVNVTDAGLVHLKGMAKLRYLDFRGSSVTDEGINDLKKALPDCDIVR